MCRANRFLLVQRWEVQGVCFSEVHTTLEARETASREQEEGFVNKKKALKAVSIMQFGSFIDGEWVQLAHESSPSFQVVNPATEGVIAEVSVSSSAIVDLAVQSSSNAFFSGPWGATSAADRAKVMRALADLVANHKAKLSYIEAENTGKPLEECMWDLDDVSGVLNYYAGLIEKRDPCAAVEVDVGDDEFACAVGASPVGVVGAIVPWNYPLLMAFWKIAPALAAGCTVVVKPSEYTPLSLLEVAPLFEQAGLPRGVINIVTGTGPKTGEALVRHSRVNKVSFTGSLHTGQHIARLCATNMTNVTLELGGKSPAIVFNDISDLDAVVEWVMFGCFWTNGQICSATSRLLVQEGLMPEFIARLAECTKQIPLGRPLDDANLKATGMLGPVINKDQYFKVLGCIDKARRQGARVVCGGQASGAFECGYFIEPTVLIVTPQMDIFRDEVFGPVLAVVPFKTEKDAVALANDCDYGLAAAVFSSDQACLNRVERKLRCGIVWKNTSQPCFPQLPWGGHKKTGNGTRDLGEAGLSAYLEPKSVVQYKPATKPLGWYNMLPPRAKL
jgi:betaine-aldehyde dehydrogenase